MSEDDNLSDEIPCVDLIKAKELIKMDLMEKSNQYETLEYGNQEFMADMIRKSNTYIVLQSQKTKELEPKLRNRTDEVHKHPFQDLCLRITDTVPEAKSPNASWNLSLLWTNTHFYATNIVLSAQNKEPGWYFSIWSVGMVNEKIAEDKVCITHKL